MNSAIKRFRLGPPIFPGHTANLLSPCFFDWYIFGVTISYLGAGAFGGVGRGVGSLEAANCQGLELLRELQLLLLYTLIDYIGCQHVVLTFHQHI